MGQPSDAAAHPLPARKLPGHLSLCPPGGRNRKEAADYIAPR